MSVSSRFVCSACRGAARSVFAPKSTPNGWTGRAPRTVYPARSAFSTSISRKKDQQNPVNSDPETAFLDVKGPSQADVTEREAIAATEGTEQSFPAVSDTPSEATPSPAAAAVPWYLRRQSTPHTPVQAAEIPDLPTNPPPILAELLEYIAVTAGLDELTLLDLRDLDPPPALGPKLIMLIATARSERHLHVAADRFARWLRREHGLKANAAGLLGRNELKIKLRRKAKRMRMLANVGATLPEGNIDDGIRTGWICCTLSKVEAHPEDTHMPGDDVKEFIGFRDVKPGVNIVVQMFTEEKRAETDLETLWGGVLRTKKREERTADEQLRELERDLEELETDEAEEKAANEREQTASKSAQNTLAAETHRTPVQQFRRPKPTAGDAFPDATQVPSAKEMKRQMRRLHTVGLA